MSAVAPLLQSLGFVGDPFESTNADREPSLSKYFVPPPYFNSVMGDPAAPKSQVILAPRGGGKSAQRRMIEIRSGEIDDLLCVSYDEFDVRDVTRATEVDRNFHLKQINRRLLLNLLVVIQFEPQRAAAMSGSDKDLLRVLGDRLLTGLTQQEYKRALDSIKQIKDTVRETVNKTAGPMAIGINFLLAKLGGGGDVKVSGGDLQAVLAAKDMNSDEDSGYVFTRLLSVARSLGFSSTYVLVDRVDELPFTTSNAPASVQFLEPLLTDLALLEADDVAFKIFLWDQARDALLEAAFRRDRTAIHELSWSIEQLQDMLSHRLRAYSGGKVSSLGELFTGDSVPLDADRLVAAMASGSPRDMIRLCSRVTAEATKGAAREHAFTPEAMWKGLQQFCNEKAEETFGKYLPDLRRAAAPTFSLSQLASDKFRINQNNAKRKLQLWEKTGLVGRIGDVARAPGSPGRAPYLFGITDLRLLVAAAPGAHPSRTLAAATSYCPSCGSLQINDQAEITCTHCQEVYRKADAETIVSSA